MSQKKQDNLNALIAKITAGRDALAARQTSAYLNDEKRSKGGNAWTEGVAVLSGASLAITATAGAAMAAIPFLWLGAKWMQGQARRDATLKLEESVAQLNEDLQWNINYLTNEFHNPSHKVASLHFYDVAQSCHISIEIDTKTFDYKEMEFN